MANLPASIFDLRVIEDVVDDAQQMLAGVLDLGQVIALLNGEVGAQRQVGHADNRIHRRADFMAHVGQEIRFRLGGGFGSLLGLLQGEAGGLQVGRLLDGRLQQFLGMDVTEENTDMGCEHLRQLVEQLPPLFG